MNSFTVWFAFAADAAAAALMAGLILKTKSLSKALGTAGNPFEYLRCFAWAVIGMAVFDCLKEYADVEGGILPQSGILDATAADRPWILLHLAFDIADIFMTTVILFMWLEFLCWYLYRDIDYNERTFRKWVLPLLISGVIAVAALILIVYTGRVSLIIRITYILYMLIRVYYFLSSLWMIHVYRSQDGLLSFFNIWSFFLPMFAGWIIEDFTVFSLRSLGSAVGVLFLYASMAQELKYRDLETWFYNRDYMGYLKTLVRQEKLEYFSALIFTTGDSVGSMAGLSEILEQMLPLDCKPFRRSEREAVVFTKACDREPLSMVAEDVKELMDAKADILLRRKDESAEEFLVRVF